MEQSLLYSYVKNRETYDEADNEARILQVYRMSAPRMQAALNRLWPYAGEMFLDDEVDRAMADRGIAPVPSSLKPAWDRTVAAVLDEATLARPADGWHQKGGKKGNEPCYQL